ncbi:hypothetical protein LK459_11430 [Gordonia otitidis]|uniref:hypothetical protein n=1 Tax=Gordonia otitidis TaxID=249058 RepID=UPI001D13DF0E|nr:hypothetical protein [Gordonia otitidis]UEA61363.1 hypothetical protein LK459_11430 [Gordonia otitidis]
MTTAMEGDVVAADVSVILPPSKDEKLRSLSQKTPEQQVDEVTTMLVQSNAGLLVAIAAQDLPGIAEAKAKAATIAEIAKQLRLGKDMQLHAAEFCRRAERGLGVAIREGQERGEVRRKGQVENRSNQHGRVGESVDNTISSKPTDYASQEELSGNMGSGIYTMTDNVSDDQFEEAVTEAKAEGNLSRANVARKCKAKANPAPLIDENDPEIDAEVAPNPADMPRRNKPDPGPRPFKKSDTEMLAEIAGSLANFADLIGYIQPERIGTADAERLCIQAFHALSRIRKHFKEINSNVKA